MEHADVVVRMNCRQFSMASNYGCGVTFSFECPRFAAFVVPGSCMNESIRSSRFRYQLSYLPRIGIERKTLHASRQLRHSRLAVEPGGIKRAMPKQGC